MCGGRELAIEEARGSMEGGVMEGGGMDEKPMRILLVCDDNDDARRVSDFLAESVLLDLRGSRLELVHARRLSQALDHLAERRFDAVLLDMTVDGPDGSTPFHMLYERAPEIPILLMAGKAGEQQALEAVRAGAQDILERGAFDRHGLLLSIRCSIERGELLAENRRRGRALRANEAGFRAMIEHNADSILCVDREGIIQFVNPAAEAMFTRCAKDLVGVVFGFPLSTSEATEIQIPRPGGETIVAEMRVVATELGGKPLFIATLRDVTARKDMENELREGERRLRESLSEMKGTQAELTQSERLKALGQMATGIVHDLSNVLTPVKGFSNLLLAHPENLQDTEKARRYLEVMSAGAEEAARIVRRLREFYRQRGKEDTAQVVDLNLIVKEAVAFTRPEWDEEPKQRGLTIRVETDLGGSLSVLGNDAELRKMVVNLILNSVEAMPNGGGIVIRTRLEGGRIEMVVRDTGEGMPEDIRKHCLEPLFSTKKSLGAGMGLAVVYGIVTRHEGSIEIWSDEGKGTVVTIRLRPWDLAEPDGAGSQPAEDKLRVLVVDDEPHVREMIREFLVGEGHIVETASNGVEALDTYNRGRFDLVVTDYALPLMDGAKLASEVKRSAPGKPVIMLTGHGDRIRSEMGSPKDVDLLIDKPVSIEELMLAVRKVLV